MMRMLSPFRNKYLADESPEVIKDNPGHAETQMYIALPNCSC
jgi:hypothetical protein